MTETENPAIIHAGRTITVDPRRSSQDKDPWRGLDVGSITGQTIEEAHVFDVHMGETVVPYATLEPLKAILPFKRGDTQLPADPNGVGGVRLSALERRMRERWQTVSGLWDGYKRPVNKLDLLAQLDYIHKLSSQLEWQNDSRCRPVRLVYTSAGEPTAAMLHDDSALVENVLFWLTCNTIQEANYLLAIHQQSSFV